MFPLPPSASHSEACAAVHSYISQGLCGRGAVSLSLYCLLDERHRLSMVALCEQHIYTVLDARAAGSSMFPLFSCSGSPLPVLPLMFASRPGSCHLGSCNLGLAPLRCLVSSIGRFPSSAADKYDWLSFKRLWTGTTEVLLRDRHD